MEELLKMEHISKRFGSFYANRDVCLTVNRGEVLTLLGENGAGKSTLMNILIGLYQPTEGKIFLNGREVRIDSPSQAVKLGIGMVHQHFMLVEAMTVFENIILGDKNSKGVFVDREARKSEILALSQRYGLDVELDKLITDISVGAQQRVEILKALYHGADLLILDEPSAALTDIEVEGLFAIMHKLVDEGKSIIFISHKMREVLHISDRITILRAGEVVTTVHRGETDGQKLANLMIGRELSGSQYEKKEVRGDTVLRLENVKYHESSKHNGLAGVSMEIRPGEIVGIAGVDGNGQTQLAQIVTGVIAPESGSLSLKESAVSVYDPSAFIEEGVSHRGQPGAQKHRQRSLQHGPGAPPEKGGHQRPRGQDGGKIRRALHLHRTGGPQSLRRQPAEGHPGPGAGVSAGTAGGRPPHPGPGHRRHPLCPRPDD